jgi:hypothetical protein
MPIATLLLIAVAQAAPPAAAIEHAGVACVVAGQFPAIDAKVEKLDRVAKARTYFHADEDARWYYVEMKPANGVLRGVLPKPLATAKRIHYYIEVTDKSAGQNRTPDYAPEVVSDASACTRTGMVAAAAMAAGKVAVAAPAGAASAPTGFAASSVAAAGGGVSATALVVGTVAVAGGGAAAVVVAKGGDKDGDGGPDDFPLIVVDGTVYSDPCCGTGIIGRDNRANSRRIPGALISNSRDSTTATSNAQGVFRLETQIRCSAENVTTGGPPFTLTIAAPGCETLNVTQTWGCAPSAPGFYPLNIICR